MSIKTSIKDHFTNNQFKEHFKSSGLKTHWNYFFQGDIDNEVSKLLYLDSELDFREFSPEDLDECTLLYRKVFTQYPWYDEWESFYQARKYLKELIDNPVFEGLVVRQDLKMVAVCLGHQRTWWMGKEFVVDEFFVENGRQGNGIGTRTLDLLTTNLLKDGYNRLILLTNKEIPAEMFYLKNGFYNNEKRTVMVKELGKI